MFTLTLTASCILITGCSHKQKMTQQLITQARQDMVFVKGGSFIMGPKPGSKWMQYGANSPQHKVTLDSFYISKYNVDYGKYDIYSKLTNQKLIDPDGIQFHSFYRKANMPIGVLTWYQAHNYCHWLAKKTGLAYDLPTEAQWEYAARAGGKPNWPFATNNGQLELGKNFPSEYMIKHQKGNSGHDLLPMPIGSLPRNPLGIYGMDGEINQWVQDWYDVNYYAHSPEHNPQGPKTGTKKVVRGGGPGPGSSLENNAYGRYGQPPHEINAGFRCVINSSLPPNQLGITTK